MPSIPVNRYLVPAEPDALPAAFIQVRQPLLRGLPDVVRLDAELSLAVYVPTGDALLWRDAEGSEIIATAADDVTPNDATKMVEPVARAIPRLVLRRAGANIASMALLAGARQSLPDDGVSGALVEVVVIDYQVTSGSLHSTGDTDSFIQFAWRRIDRGTRQFALPPIDPRVAERFTGIIRSEVGGSGGGQLNGGQASGGRLGGGQSSPGQSTSGPAGPVHVGSA